MVLFLMHILYSECVLAPQYAPANAQLKKSLVSEIILLACTCRNAECCFHIPFCRCPASSVPGMQARNLSVLTF